MIHKDHQSYVLVNRSYEFDLTYGLTAPLSYLHKVIGNQVA